LRDQEEIFLLVKCLREIGNVPIVEKKYLRSHLNHHPTDQFIAEIVGLKEEPRDSAANPACPVVNQRLYFGGRKSLAFLRGFLL